MSNFIFLRGLKHVDHTVFVVAKGQKTYWDEQFQTNLPFSSGQQVKRVILESLIGKLNELPTPVEFYWQVKKDKKTLKQGEAFPTCNPQFADQLIGGWMMAKSNKNDVEDEDESNEDETSLASDKETVKRRSPLSISALRPLHPLLATTNSENITFDRSDRPDYHKVLVRDFKGNVMTEDQLEKFLRSTNHIALSPRKWVPDQKGSNARANGLFVFDIAIDLRTLFCVSLSKRERELSDDVIERLKEAGWIEGKNAFGPCLICPKDRREKIIPALAHALVNWRITTNQARTYSPQETLAVAISDNANRIAGAIRAKLVEEDENKAKPIVDETIPGTDVFVTLACAAYIPVNDESYDALEKAEAKLIDMMNAFDFENQLK